MTEDATTARLLRLAGRRPDVPAARAARVRAGVHQAWSGEVRRRRIRRTLVAVPAALAAAVGIILLVYMSRPQDAVGRAAVVGTVERVEGAVPLASADPVRAGQWIATGGSSRAAVRLANGTSLRIDEGSRVRLLTTSIIELAGGAIYLDTVSDTSAMEVRTPFGTAADIGTQFEVRLAGESLRVRVRTGAVVVRRERESIQAGAGTELTITSEGAQSRTVPSFGPDWSWTTALAPAFAIEGRPLHAFLEHLSRENGWSLRYEDAALARDAAAVVLHGSVEGLDATAALSVGLTAADLSYTLERGELYVCRPVETLRVAPSDVEGRPRARN